MYRDSFDKCPRCAVELADAGSARRCPGCGGLFVEDAVLSEMILEMLPPGPLGRLQLTVLDRDEPALACPTCDEPMQRTAIHHVPIDRCGKGHGAWFDRDELGTALLRTSQVGAAGVLVELSAIERRVVPRSPPPPPVEPSVPPVTAPSIPPSVVPIVDPAERILAITIETEGQASISSQLVRKVIKIGRMSSAHVVLPHDEVNRMHAAIENEPARVRIIDLGSTIGTFVNEARVIVKDLQSGDRVRIGPYTLVVTFD